MVLSAKENTCVLFFLIRLFFKCISVSIFIRVTPNYTRQIQTSIHDSNLHTKQMNAHHFTAISNIWENNSDLVVVGVEVSIRPFGALADDNFFVLGLLDDLLNVRKTIENERHDIGSG